MSHGDVDIDMQDIDEDELLGSPSTDDALDESMKDIKLENTDGDSTYEAESKNEGHDLGLADDDEGAASDAEFAAEDDRKSQSRDMKWQWHIELYPIAFEDMQLENFTKMYRTASHTQMIFTEHSTGQSKGEAHFYTDKLQAAKTIIRNLCCKKFHHQRPFIYISRRNVHSGSDIETAVLRLELAEAAKMRWDKQKKTAGESPSNIAKVENVPAGTSADFLSVVFARAYKIIPDTDKCEKDTKETKYSEMKEECTGSDDKCTENVDISEGEVVDKKELGADENAAEGNVSKHSGDWTVENVSRTSFKGFLLGYRRVTIGNQKLVITPLPTEGIDMQALRKEARERRQEESQQTAVATRTPPRKVSTNEKTLSAKDSKAQSSEGGEEKWHHRDERGGAVGGADRGRNSGGGRASAGGTRGGRGGSQHTGSAQGGGWGRGGMMKTGRQKMNEKSMRRGGAQGGAPFRGPAGGSFRAGQGDGSFSHDIRLLQSQLQMNTLQLQRQIDSLSMMNRVGYHDFPEFHRGPHARSMLSEWDEDWSWDTATPSRGRYPGPRGAPRGKRQ